MLTKRERVYATINRANLDAIPWQFNMTQAVIRKLEAYYGVEWEKALDDHVVYVTPHSLVPEDIALAPDTVRNEYGAVWRRSARDYTVGDWGELVEYPLKEPSLFGYSFPDGTRKERWDNAPQVREKYPDHFLVAHGYGLFEHGWALCGFENYLSYVASEHKFIEELTEGLAQFSCDVTLQLAGTGVDAIRIGDDWGFQSTLMMQPDVWRKLYKKYYQRVYAAAHQVGLVVSIHSCGNITALLPDLIEIGVQVVHPLQPEAMNVAFCQREYGRDLTFWGGLGSQSTLPYGTPDDVRREVRERLDLFHAGGYILAPAGSAPAETPAENIAAIVDEARMQFA